jgi:hypothetical protein
MRYAEAAHLIQSELLVDDVRLVILRPQSDCGPEANLLGFRPSGELIWTLSPPTDAPAIWDGFVNIWVQEDQVWVGSWSGFSLRIDHRTGEVVEQVFTK